MKAVSKVDIVDGKCVVTYSDGSEQELYEYPPDENATGVTSVNGMTGNVVIPTATTSVNGLMSKTDKSNLESARAELTDIRVGADGTVYQNAGDAVRGQITDLKSDLTIVTQHDEWFLQFGNIYPTLIEPLTYGSSVVFEWSSASDLAFILVSKRNGYNYWIPVPESKKLEIPNNSNLWVNLTTRELVIDTAWHYDENHIFMGRCYFGRLMGGDFVNEFRSVLLSAENSDTKISKMFSRDVFLALGNRPIFNTSGNVITVTIPNVAIFVSKQLGTNNFYNFGNLGGTYTVPQFSICAINLTAGAIQILTAAELFASTDEFAVLFWNHYGYPKFGWEHYYYLNNIENEIRNSNIFQNEVALSLGNKPSFSVDSSLNITVTFDGNMFIGEKLSASTVFNFSGLGGSYVVPSSSWLVVNMTSGTIQILTTAQLFASSDKFAVLIFNHYGYPKFGWERYYLQEQDNAKIHEAVKPYAYSGERITIKPTVKYNKIANTSKGYTQGGACYGNYLFQFHSQDAVESGDFHGCTVVNLSTGKEVQFIDLGYNVNRHNNNASFGTLKYDSNDTFPVLYVSQEGSTARCINVYRIVETGNSSAPFALTLVQTINVPTEESWAVTYPNACVGDDGNIYILGYIGNNTYSLLKYSSPTLSSETVQFSIDDAISNIQIVIETNAQGFIVNDGKLYVSAGASSYAVLKVYALTDGHELSTVAFNNIDLPYEPEALFLYESVLCCTFAYNGGTVIRFDF